MFRLNIQFIVTSDDKHGTEIRIETPLAYLSISFYRVDFMSLERFSGIQWGLLPKPMFIHTEGSTVGFKYSGRHGYSTPEEWGLRITTINEWSKRCSQ